MRASHSMRLPRLGHGFPPGMAGPFCRGGLVGARLGPAACAASLAGNLPMTSLTPTLQQAVDTLLAAIEQRRTCLI